VLLLGILTSSAFASPTDESMAATTASTQGIQPAVGGVSAINNPGNTSQGQVGDVSYGFGATTDSQASNTSIVGVANASSTGYWEVATDGGVFNFNSTFYGSKGGQQLNTPMAGMAATPDHGGYWEFGVDGGVFNFGDANFYGSNPGNGVGWDFGGPQTVALVPTLDGGGYWLVDADGGVFTFGDAPYYGSLPGSNISTLEAVSATNWGNGYAILLANGTVYTFNSGGSGSAAPAGSLNIYTNPATAISTDATHDGYWMTDRTGQVWAWGTATYEGGFSGTPNGPMDGIAGSGDAGYITVGADGGTFNYNLPFEGNATVNMELTPSYAQQIAMVQLPESNWGTQSQWTNGLSPLWNAESGWRWNVCYGGALYPNCNYSGAAYGIPQANPGSKMCTTGPACYNSTAYETNAWTQMMWGYWYIGVGNHDSYNGQHVTNPILAWEFDQANGGYMPSSSGGFA
jgi:hypothetical protein